MIRERLAAGGAVAAAFASCLCCVGPLAAAGLGIGAYAGAVEPLRPYLLAASAVALFAKPIPGPKGGRILTTEAPHIEFFVEKDRTVTVTFYDKALKPVAATGQVVAATAEAKSGKVQLAFAEKNGAFVSKTALPEGDDYNVVVQIRANANARPTNYRCWHGSWNGT